jgi:hypothetical protein
MLYNLDILHKYNPKRRCCQGRASYFCCVLLAKGVQIVNDGLGFGPQELICCSEFDRLRVNGCWSRSLVNESLSKTLRG